MDAIPDATDEELEAFPNYMCTFHKWMIRQGKKEATARAYVRNMALLFEDDGKGPASMATQEYFEITKVSFKNKCANNSRSAAVRAFMEFWASHNGGPLEDAAGVKVYQVKGRPVRARSEQVAERVAPEGDEARQLRVDLGLPDEGWSVDIRSRSDGEMILAVSPNGSAYRSRQAVQRRLSQNNSQEADVAAAAASSATVLAASSSAGSSSQTPRQVRPPSEAPPAALLRTASTGSSAPARPPPGQAVPVRRTIPVSEALARFNSGAQARQALLSSGRDPAARLAQRIHGLYFVQDERMSGRPVFRKLDDEKPTIVFFNEAKGLWRMTETVETKGDFAKVKDDAQAPWEISRPWRVYNGATYEEDPNLRLILLDSSALPEGAEVEVCAPLDDSEATPASASGAAGIGGEEGSPAKKAKLEGKDDSKKDTPVKTKRKSKEPENQEDEKAVEEESGIARHSMALAEALSRFNSSGDREAVLVSGRKASAKNAQRVNGLYLREEVDGTTVWTKVGCPSKFAALSFNSAKGQWQISKGLDTKGDYAHAKDKAENPWEVKKTWKAFDGESYVEDPDISVSLIDRASLPDVQIEVDQPSSSSRQPSREPSACSFSQASQASALLPQDAPEDHIIHSRLKFESRTYRVYFNFPAPDGKKIAFQTTIGAAGSRENAEVIARACYVKFEEGLTKDQVTAFRNECYDRLKSGSGSTASPGGSTSAVAEEDPHGHKKRRRDEEETEKDPDAKNQAKAARKKSSKAVLSEEPVSAPVAEAAEPVSAPVAEAAEQASAPAAEAPEAKKANSDDESSSTSSSSASDGEAGKDAGENDEVAREDVENDEAADAGQVEAPSRKPLRPTGPLGRLGRVAAKMSVRTGLRCWCCYETACVRAPG